MEKRAMDLYDAYEQGMLPENEGYIVSGFYMPDTPYSILEIVSYSEVKSMHAAKDMITFQSEGKKIHILVEPSSYSQKSVEPYIRPQKYQIPLRFSELNIHTCKNQYKIMYNKEPVQLLSSFTILKPVSANFSFIVFPRDDVKQSLQVLLREAFQKNSAIPMQDAKTVGDEIAEMVVSKLCFPNIKKGSSFESTNTGKIKTTNDEATKTVQKAKKPAKSAEKTEKAEKKAKTSEKSAKTDAKSAKSATKPERKRK